jgi:hypothetical protein
VLRKSFGKRSAGVLALDAFGVETLGIARITGHMSYIRNNEDIAACYNVPFGFYL